MKKYIQLQESLIRQYRIDLCDGTKCPKDWWRTHAHVRNRRVCKWVQKNSAESTFTLLHEIGHIETTTSKMRRVESEYHATVWAITRCKEFGIEIPRKLRELYQNYIDQELDRGLRRGGSNYAATGYKLNW